MTNETSYDSPQTPRGYYYQPLKDDGPFEKRLEAAGEIIGKSIAQASATEETGGELPEISMAMEAFGEKTGGLIGKTAGFYIDNASAILKNAQTFVDQLNDYRTWADPFSSAMMGENAGD